MNDNTMRGYEQADIITPSLIEFVKTIDSHRLAGWQVDWEKSPPNLLGWQYVVGMYKTDSSMRELKTKLQNIVDERPPFDRRLHMENVRKLKGKGGKIVKGEVIAAEDGQEEKAE